MRRALLLGSLLLLAVLSLGAGISPASGTAAGDGLTIQQAAQTDGSAPINRVAHQVLAGDARAAVTTQGVDVGAALEISRTTGDETLAEYTLAERLRRTTDDVAVLEEGIDELANDVDATRERRSQLRRAYLAGEIDAAEFASGLARQQARTDRQRGRLAWLQSRLDTRLAPGLRSRADRLERELLGLEDPVQRETLAALRGSREEVRVYVAGSANGTVLATVGEDAHLRSVFRADLRRFDPATFGLPAAASRAEELYPLAFGGDLGSNTAIRGRVGGAYFIESDLPFGTVAAFLDGHTRTVFAEVQRRSLADVRQPETATKRANDTQVIVNKTYPGGPLRIATLDNRTGEPANSTVLVGDSTLQTGPDGVVWTVAPPGKTMRIRVLRDTRRVSMIVRTLELSAIDAS